MTLDRIRPAEPAEPAEPVVTAAPARDRSSKTSRLRIGLVAVGVTALAVGAVGTAFASPSPSSAIGSTGAAVTTGWAAPANLGDIVDGEAGALDHGRLGGRHGFRDITVRAVEGSNLSLATSDGWTRTVAVTDAMELTKGGQAIELGDIAVGDEIRLRQDVAEDGTVTVTGIVVVVPSVGGIVSDLSSSGFKVTTRDGSIWTITLDGSTRYRYGAGDGTLADIANGDVVLVLGTASGDNALTATTVAVRGDRAAGVVTATTASTIAITTRDGETVTINVDGDTTYRMRGETDASLASVTVGSIIGASGREATDGSLDADVVMIGGGDGAGERGGRGFGRGDRGGFGPGAGFGHSSDDDAPTDGGATDAG